MPTCSCTARSSVVCSFPVGVESQYELHPVVREVLLAQLEEDPERARELHGRAAASLEADGEFADALEHLARAGRHRDAFRLLSSIHLSLYDAGRYDVVRNTIDALPADAYATDFAATMEFTWCQVLVDRGALPRRRRRVSHGGRSGRRSTACSPPG